MLKREFHNSVKHPDQFVAEYLTALKDIADSIDAINSFITDWDLVVQALTGFPDEYDPFITTYGNTCYDFGDLRSKLLVLEQQLSRRMNATMSEDHHAFVGSAVDNSSFHQRGRG